MPKRLVAHELILSFVPDAEQRLWRTVMRRRYQLTRNRVQLHNRLESLLEEAHLKLSIVVSDLLGVSARRMLPAIADGATDPRRRSAHQPENLEIYWIDVEGGVATLIVSPSEWLLTACADPGNRGYLAATSVAVGQRPESQHLGRYDRQPRGHSGLQGTNQSVSRTESNRVGGSPS